jgi:hypothetical protein
VNYADDFVILSRGKAAEALEWTRGVLERLKQTLRGWAQYFQLGRPWNAFEVLDEYVEDRVRHFLRKRHKVSSQGARQFSRKRIYGQLGVFRLRDQLGGARS